MAGWSKVQAVVWGAECLDGGVNNIMKIQTDNLTPILTVTSEHFAFAHK